MGGAHLVELDVVLAGVEGLTLAVDVEVSAPAAGIVVRAIVPDVGDAPARMIACLSKLFAPKMNHTSGKRRSRVTSKMNYTSEKRQSPLTRKSIIKHNDGFWRPIAAILRHEDKISKTFATYARSPKVNM